MLNRIDLGDGLLEPCDVIGMNQRPQTKRVVDRCGREAEQLTPPAVGRDQAAGGIGSPSGPGIGLDQMDPVRVKGPGGGTRIRFGLQQKRMHDGGREKRLGWRGWR